VLTPSTLACLSNVATVNLTAGCAHGCLYCYSRGYSTYPGENRIVLYANTLKKLRAELPRKRKPPVAIYFSPSSDLFQPIPEVLELSYEILDFLLRMKQRVSFLTKGRIPPRHMALLKANAPQVHASIGVISLDEKLIRTFEPGTASPRIRLRQAEELAAAGMLTQVRVDPILPGLTDDQQTLEDLCNEVARCGVRDIAASILFLRPGVVKGLRRNIKDRRLIDQLLSRFDTSERLDIYAEKSSVVALRLPERRGIYARLGKIAKEYDLNIHICSCKNPDVTNAPCSIAGRWATKRPSRQQSLF
jgi:DNA repair photolyase